MHKYVMTAIVVCLPVAVFGWQGQMAAVGVTESGLQAQLERATRQKGDGLAIPLLGQKSIAAARALSEPLQIALMRELGAAAKTILMAPAFQAAHEAFIAKEFTAVNHGIQVKSSEQLAMASGASKAAASEFEAKMKRDIGAMYVDMVKTMPIPDLKMMLSETAKDWNKNAASPTRTDRAKYARLAERAKAVDALSASDPDKFRRGVAVLLSAQNDGPDTEEALYGGAASAQNEAEQLAWNEHNLRGNLKRILSQAVTESASVDFAAPTVMKSGVRVFVNPAYEKKSLTWKAMFRAGKGPAMAGVEIARAWLKEL
jgi:hypothetical protein